MAENTQSTQTGGLGLTMEDLYDLLMANIEPELTRANIETLDDKYKDETPEQKKARGERYAKAFDVFEQRFSDVLNIWKDELQVFKKSALAQYQVEAGAEDAQEIAAIERSLKSE